MLGQQPTQLVVFRPKETELTLRHKSSLECAHGQGPPQCQIARVRDQLDGETRSLSSGRYRLDLARIRAPAFLYCSRDDASKEMTRTAEALGAPLYVLDGLNHVETFCAVDQVLPLVLPFIAANCE